ncbi:hypothetical protein Pla100_51810 [Neorhodopirellula pilleata]|uniref:Uncharacterized protein n=1 Tax=Neorhodopirellula pilleata TaxID=2714738 RepID=A0A5C5ZYD8_9BACT|nr:hypothetical protein Pla100_51810 [Neorhodopirellula pilleata]
MSDQYEKHTAGEAQDFAHSHLDGWLLDRASYGIFRCQRAHRAENSKTTGETAGFPSVLRGYASPAEGATPTKRRFNQSLPTNRFVDQWFDFKLGVPLIRHDLFQRDDDQVVVG